MITANGTVTLRPKEVVPVYREEWDATVEDYKYDLFNRDFVSRNGVIYQVKKQRVNEFVPAGLDPAGENGEDYWEAFNNLAPSVANFLIIIDEDGEPATLLSGGRIQARFLNIGSLNMSETRLWGGAEPMTGKGLALINDPGDRKFVVYNDANNYVEMFMRDEEWGLKGVVEGNVDDPIFQLGSKNKIGPFVYNKNDLEAIYTSGEQVWRLRLSASGLHLGRNEATLGGVGIHVGPGAGGMTNAVLFINGGDFWHQAGKFYASEIIARGLLELKSHLRFNESAHESAYPYSWSYSSNGTIPTANRRLVYVSGNTGSDNTCTLDKTGAVDGQVITIINTNTSHRLNITGTAKGNHWILEGCCGTFRYLSGYKLWYPERFSW